MKCKCIRLYIVRSLKMYIRMLIFLDLLEDFMKSLMKSIIGLLGELTKTEKIIWISSITLIVLSFMIFDRENYLTLSASLLGAASLIFSAKGNPAGQVLMIIFSVLYGMISYTFEYYGEMITYLGMTAPMAVGALISWLRNPFSSASSEVRVNSLKRREIFFMLLLTAVVTLIFYFILKAFDTPNLIPGTLSVSTSFAAVYLTFRRSAFFAAAYAMNDIILIILWTLAALEDVSYVSVIVCFAVFLVNDIYGFISWRKMQKRQSAASGV